jgi:hypothetical protein
MNQVAARAVWPGRSSVLQYWHAILVAEYQLGTFAESGETHSSSARDEHVGSDCELNGFRRRPGRPHNASKDGWG